MTVRNNKDKIIQFSYGEDHFDSTKVENQSLPIVDMTMEDIYMHYDIPGLNSTGTGSTTDANLLQSIFTKGTITRFKKQTTQLKSKIHTYIEKLREENPEKMKEYWQRAYQKRKEKKLQLQENTQDNN